MSREEVIELLEKEKIYMVSHGGNMLAMALDIAIRDVNEEAFRDAHIKQMIKEQDNILDKIKAEIEALPKTYPFVNHFDMYVKVSDVVKIINKYKERSEG